MAGLKGITVNTPPEDEPHIYAEDDASIFQSMYGEDGVSTIGQQCSATVLSNNKIRIADGVAIVGGHFARIPYGEYEDCEITNGQSGKNRNDIIVASFETTGTGGIDIMQCSVIQGESGSIGVDPSITRENLYGGGKLRQLPLYRVRIEGLSVVDVEPMFEIIKTNKELQIEVNELNSKLPYCIDYKFANITVPANSGSIATVAPDVVPVGHKIIGVIPSQSGSNLLYFYNNSINADGSITIQLKNTYSSAITVAPLVTLICQAE